MDLWGVRIVGSNLIPSRAALGLGREEGMLAMLPRFASLPDFADVNSPAQLLSVTNTHCAKLGPKTRLETTKTNQKPNPKNRKKVTSIKF